MLNEILNLVKSQATDHFINQTEVPNEYAGQAAEVAGNSIVEALTEQIAGGNADDLISMLGVGQSGGSTANMLQSALGQQVLSKLMGNLGNMGVESGVAQQAANSILPGLLQQVTGKFTSPAQENAGFNIENMISGVLQQQGGNLLGDMAKNILGGLGK